MKCDKYPYPLFLSLFVFETYNNEMFLFQSLVLRGWIFFTMQKKKLNLWNCEEFWEENEQ